MLYEPDQRPIAVDNRLQNNERRLMAAQIFGVIKQKPVRRCGGAQGVNPPTMPRKATSPAEFDQIDRVRMLLRGFRLHPSPDLRVTTVGQKAYVGLLVRDHVGNNGRKGGRLAYYGSVVLLTDEGEVEIDYLDIVLIEPKGSMAPASPAAGSVAPCGTQDGSGMLPA
jgi:hypothetical protein